MAPLISRRICTSQNLSLFKHDSKKVVPIICKIKFPLNSCKFLMITFRRFKIHTEVVALFIKLNGMNRIWFNQSRLRVFNFHHSAQQHHDSGAVYYSQLTSGPTYLKRGTYYYFKYPLV